VKAVLIESFGGPERLRVCDRQIPAPGPREVVLRVLAAGVNPLDLRKRRGELAAFYGRRFPQEVGNELVGTVVAAGRAVTRWRPGDQVFCLVDSGRAGLLPGFPSGGGYAEYCVTRDHTLASIPEAPDPADLAAVPLAGLTALQGLRKAGYAAKRSLLVIGAGGGVGLFVVQLARAQGLAVDAVASQNAFALLRSLGVRECFDYRDQDPATLPGSYDLVFDVAAASTFRRLRHLLPPGGVYLSNVLTLASAFGTFRELLRPLLPGVRGHRFNWVVSRGRDLADLGNLLAAGTVRPFVAETYSLEQAALAQSRLEAGGVVGKVILRVSTVPLGNRV
jgi:NADPH:quinone reductase-like Zn-dependent oxidoreductase